MLLIKIFEFMMILDNSILFYLEQVNNWIYLIKKMKITFIIYSMNKFNYKNN